MLTGLLMSVTNNTKISAASLAKVTLPGTQSSVGQWSRGVESLSSWSLKLSLTHRTGVAHMFCNHISLANLSPMDVPKQKGNHDVQSSHDPRKKRTQILVSTMEHYIYTWSLERCRFTVTRKVIELLRCDCPRA